MIGFAHTEPVLNFAWAVALLALAVSGVAIFIAVRGRYRDPAIDISQQLVDAAAAVAAAEAIANAAERLLARRATVGDAIATVREQR